MPRIPDEIVERAKREISLEQLAKARELKLSRRGSDLVAPCPFGEHEDQDPSFVITPQRNLFHCFGCGAAGSPIDFVMRLEGLAFREAVTWLVDRYLPDVELADAPPALAKLPKEEIEQLLAASDHELREWVVSFYREALQGHEKARGYLASRGLDDPGLLERFEVGFADRELGLRLPTKRVKAGAAIRERLTSLGFFKPTGHEAMTGRVVVPVRDLSGRLVQLYGRTINSNLRRGTPKHLYLAGPIDGVFHGQAVTENPELILCESILDALTFVRHGFGNVTTSFGVNGFSPALSEAMKAHDTRRVLVAYDRDDAGETAAKKLARKLLAEGIDAYRVCFPRGMDANAYACKVQPAAKSLDLVLRQAQWMGNGQPPRWQVDLPAEASEPAAGPDEPLARATKKEEALPEPSAEPAHDPQDSGPAEAAPEASSSLAASPATKEVGEPGGASSAAEPSLSKPSASEPSPTLLPAPPPPEIPTEIREHEILLRAGDRTYRVRGFAKNLAYDVLKINLRATRERGEGLHVDTLDLLAFRPRGSFIKQAALELGLDQNVVKRDLGRVLLRLEELQHEQIQKTLEPKAAVVSLGEAERGEAMELLRDPALVHRILLDLEACGVVGEETNKLVLYLAVISRMLRKPLAVMVQSSSAAGKSALMESVLAMVPEEHRVAYSAMTGQSLFYMGETNLCHKVLAIAEEEGAEQASYALKLLQSEGKLSIASTGKDPATGRLTTHEYHVEGPAAILTTTTSIDLDEELLNRCLVLSVDESREQTRAIHRFQREGETLEGLLARRQRDRIRERHQNAQRLLRPLGVVNLYARQLTFPESCTRTRRDHEKYLGLIRAITLLHQAQREVQTGRDEDGHPIEYIEATLEDIRLANQLAHEVLGRSLDELPPQTRRLLMLIERLVASACRELEMDRVDYRFSRREIREHTGWGHTQLKVHLRRLEEMEYLLVHGGRRGQSFVYELAYESPAEEAEQYLYGLIDVDALSDPKSTYDGKKSGLGEKKAGQNGDLAGPSRPQVGGVSGGWSGELEPVAAGVCGENGLPARNNTVRGGEKERSSYRKKRRTVSSEPLASDEEKGA